MRSFAAVAVVALLASGRLTAQRPLPVLDMHLHALPANSQGPPPLAICVPTPQWPAWDPATPYQLAVVDPKQAACPNPVISPMTDEGVMAETLAVVNRRNVFAVLSGTSNRVETWRRAAPGRFIPGLEFQLGGQNTPTVAALRALHSQGRLAVLGEVTNQYVGIAPDDARMEPYWAMAEALDIPVGIHVGPGPPGVIYLGATHYRARLHSALTVEEVLVAHPKLRLYVMHAGFPMLDDLLALLYAHPQVHVDTGVIVFTQPRAAFYRYLQAIVEAGFANRVMFGSDQMVWPGVVEPAIAAIEAAPFLSEPQKRDILYHNAARFLRLSQAEIARHHER